MDNWQVKNFVVNKCNDEKKATGRFLTDLRLFLLSIAYCQLPIDLSLATPSSCSALFLLP
jgi:hypothetical protein